MGEGLGLSLFLVWGGGSPGAQVLSTLASSGPHGEAEGVHTGDVQPPWEGLLFLQVLCTSGKQGELQ